MKDLIILATNFIDAHPVSDIEEFDAQEFLESVDESDIIAFFKEMYNVIANA